MPFERHPPSLRQLALVVVLILATGLSPVACAQVARMEIVTFASVTLTDQEFLAGREDGKPVTVAGELRLPRAGNERFPLVILLHGSGGIAGFVTDWEQELLAMGVATFVIDSFTGRGITSTNNDQSQLGRLAQTEDAYRALAVLVKHPRIDPSRVILMGFSRGGQNALYASLTRFQRMHLSASGARFAAHIALYPDCSYTYRDDDDVAAPVRIFHGIADNYDPVAPCRAYVERLRAEGKDIQITEYPGAAHVFDGRAYKPAVQLPQAQTTRNCRWEEGENGQLFNAKTKQPFSYGDPCVERGVTIAYDEEAAIEARKAVEEFVTAMLKPPRSP
ncbi:MULTISPECIES: dienelactone hydrolase family protein [Paraburkholderia]|uniref:Dienelactone hydrolase family protein n=1 Tax=Paraburkholderia madseniana TaxID=2599607 RepID=A0AAP5BMY5_9BURK|nr:MULTISPECIES: dienelactone hydrolase family protein [Paraburkholderia]MCX4151512.1 dienelactone hydrolase family protein [Paraburkholderia madseniana]MDN7154443.1 dienelactone hydrolase family protein [Paraburkholderia sp. WS6]MDQ6413325.1 dienelactone hydrolase family protein [Paraburkholderia madseniana]